MSSAEAERVKAEILRAAEVDYLDIWFIVGLAQEVLGVDDLARATEIAVGALESLLASGALRAGGLVPPGEFVPWTQTPDEAIQMIRRRLGELKGPPGVGDVAWFELPE